MRQHVDQRQEQLLALLRERGKMRVTDLAAELGISVVTARRDVESLAESGRVLRSHGEVSWPERTIPGVRRDGPVIGMMVPALPYYFSEIVRGAQTVVGEAGGRIALAVSTYRPAEDIEHVQRMLDSGVDGVLVTPSWPEGTPPAGYESWLAGLPVPAVLVERLVGGASPCGGLDRVRSAVAEGSALAVRHLAALGHQRIALMQQAGPHSDQIREGFVSALAEQDLWRPRGGLVVQAPSGGGDRELPELKLAVEQLVRLSREQSVTAALVHNDDVAIGAIPILRAMGVTVPGDLAIVSYDDEMAELADVPLTAVSPPKRQVGAAAASMVLRRIAERATDRQATPVQHLDLVPDLRIRVSCGAEAGDAKKG